MSRLRLTLAFAAVLAVLLAGAGLLLYGQLARSLDHTIAQSLRTRATDVAALVAQADTGLRDAPRNAFTHAAGSNLAQVLDLRGRVLDQTPALGSSTSLLTRAQLAAVHGAPLTIERGRRGSEPIRLLVLPVSAQGRQLLVVVGASLSARDGALASLRRELLVGSPLALLLVSSLAYALAAAALRPVDRMRTQAEALSDRLQGALERERRFVADASHELRTPLAVLRAEIDLALDRPRSRPQLEDALRSTGVEVDRLSELADHLLLLARLDRRALSIRAEPVDLADMFEGLAARFARRTRTAGRNVSIDTGAVQTVAVDRLRVEQALANLIENALRHGRGTIGLRAVPAADAIELHVLDAGPGFAPDFVPRAFERFSRGDHARGRAGAGLGLSIVAEIAAAHGGSAAAANRTDGGADVWLSLPQQ